MNALQIHELLLKGTTHFTLPSFAGGGFTDYSYDAGVFSVQPKLSSQPPQRVSEEQFQEIYHRYLELEHPPVSTDFTLPSWKKAPPLLVNAYIGRLVHYFETGK